MNSLKDRIEQLLSKLQELKKGSYCACKKCGATCKTKETNGKKVYDIYSICDCGNIDYIVKPLINNHEYVISILQLLSESYKTEIHMVLAPSYLTDKEKQIRDHIKVILTNILPFLEKQIELVKKEHVNLISKKSKQPISKRLTDLGDYYLKYMQLKDDFTALVAFRHFETFCMYVDTALGEKLPLTGSRHLFKGFYYYANSMVLNKDVHFIEKQCFAGAGKSITDCALMAFILGYDIDAEILKVFGNADNITRNVMTTIQIMTSPQYAKVFPYYEKFKCKEQAMFSVDKPASGELKVSGSCKPLNILTRSKRDSIDGVRAQYIFLDDITQSKDAEKKEMHKWDIDRFNNCWFERKSDLENTFVIASGTTYHQEDFLSWLKRTFGVEYAYDSPFRFTKLSKQNELGLKWISVFCVIYGLDENDKSTYEERFPTEIFKFKRNENPRMFYAMVQQQPQPPQGSPFDYENLPNLYGEEGIPHLPDRSQECCTASLDLARKGKDYNSMPIIVKINGELYLQDCIFERVTPDKLPPKIVDKIIKHHIVRLDIETNTDSTFDLIIRKMLEERGIKYCNVTTFYTWMKKDEKIRNNETSIKSIHFPGRGVYSPNSEMGQFMYWLTAYNYDTPPKHDDSVDSLANYSQTFIINDEPIPQVQLLSNRRFRRD